MKIVFIGSVLLCWIPNLILPNHKPEIGGDWIGWWMKLVKNLLKGWLNSTIELPQRERNFHITFIFSSFHDFTCSLNIRVLLIIRYCQIRNEIRLHAGAQFQIDNLIKNSVFFFLQQIGDYFDYFYAKKHAYWPRVLQVDD